MLMKVIKMPFWHLYTARLNFLRGESEEKNISIRTLIINGSDVYDKTDIVSKTESNVDSDNSTDDRNITWFDNTSNYTTDESTDELNSSITEDLDGAKDIDDYFQKLYAKYDQLMQIREQKHQTYTREKYRESHANNFPANNYEDHHHHGQIRLPDTILITGDSMSIIMVRYASLCFTV